jgi:hypothetical protein
LIGFHLIQKAKKLKGSSSFSLSKS